MGSEEPLTKFQPRSTKKLRQVLQGNCLCQVVLCNRLLLKELLPLLTAHRLYVHLPHPQSMATGSSASNATGCFALGTL